jgi:ABC-type cobalamin/Fe3+-siderophores transport system ATPase subunit
MAANAVEVALRLTLVPQERKTAPNIAVADAVIADLTNPSWTGYTAIRSDGEAIDYRLVKAEAVHTRKVEGPRELLPEQQRILTRAMIKVAELSAQSGDPMGAVNGVLRSLFTDGYLNESLYEKENG